MRKAYFVFAVIPALLVLALAFPVMAAEEAPPEVPLQWVHGIWTAAKAAPVAIVMALITSLAGYFSKTAPENFKLENFFFTREAARKPIAFRHGMNCVSSKVFKRM